MSNNQRNLSSDESAYAQAAGRTNLAEIPGKLEDCSQGGEKSLHNLSYGKEGRVSVNLTSDLGEACILRCHFCKSSEVLPCHCGRLICELCSEHTEPFAALLAQADAVSLTLRSRTVAVTVLSAKAYREGRCCCGHVRAMHEIRADGAYRCLACNCAAFIERREA